MTPLSDALTAAQRHALATLEKAYVAGAIEADKMGEAMEACGITDAVDRAFLVASLDVLREWGVAAPTMSERVARENEKDEVFACGAITDGGTAVSSPDHASNAATVRYEGEFELAWLRPGERVMSAGDGTGAGDHHRG